MHSTDVLVKLVVWRWLPPVGPPLRHRRRDGDGGVTVTDTASEGVLPRSQLGDLSALGPWPLAGSVLVDFFLKPRRSRCFDTFRQFAPIKLVPEAARSTTGPGEQMVPSSGCGGHLTCEQNIL